MNYNYVIYNSNGEPASITGNPSLTSISQGNNNVDEFDIAFQGHTYEEAYLTVASTLPGATSSLPLQYASNYDFTFKGTEYKGFKFVLLEAMTSIAGDLTLSFKLKSRTDDTQLCSAQLHITIHASDVPSNPTITAVQYDNLVQSIGDNYNTLNASKLDKVFSNYDLASSVNATYDNVILNQSGTPKYAKLDTIYNIKTVNNISPVDKNISLDAGDIPYGEYTVESELESLNENVETRAYKYQLDDKVGHRDGTLGNDLPSASEYHGVLPYDLVRVNNKKTEVTLDGYNLKAGDMLHFTAHDSNNYAIINGGFTTVLPNTSDIFQYVCLFAYGQSLKYYQLTLTIATNKITIEFDDDTSIPAVIITRP